MFVADAAPKVPKESAVLSEASLQLLSREVGPILEFAMYLNYPTTRLVVTKLDNDARGRSAKDLAARIMLDWKKLHEHGKDKDMVRDLERALRETNNTQAAEMLQDRFANQMEITPDAFQ